MHVTYEGGLDQCSLSVFSDNAFFQFIIFYEGLLYKSHEVVVIITNRQCKVVLCMKGYSSYST